jgi:sugar lactone lactonase YvrE
MNAAREPHSRDTACSNERTVLAAETLVMNNMQPETLAFERLEAAGQAPCEVGESPVWREQDQALYWVDIPARTIARLAVGEARRTEWRLPEKVACITFDRHGTVLAGCETGLFAITLPAAHEASARKLAAPVFPLPGMRFNDGRCDRQGRFWAGTMVQDMAAANPSGSLYRYDADGTLSAPIVDGLIVQNGLAWSPQGTTIYLSDSHPARRLVWAFDYDVDTGEPRNRRVFADLNQFAGRPDGAAVDSDGCYWTCANDAGLLLRFTPAGRLDRSIALPLSKPSMCTFGGRELDTLFITSIRPASGASEHDGHVLTVRPGVCGAPESDYAGVL